MPAQYLLHIGQQKSGTTYLQTVLHACDPQRLRALGLCYPLAPVAAAPENNQQYAMFGLLGDEVDWVTPEWQQLQRPAWDAIAEQARSWDGPVLMSAEALSVVRTEGIHRLHAALGEPDDVTVVITTRNLGSTLASSWQQHVRNGRTATFEQYLDRLGRDRDRFDADLETAPDMGFWRSYSVGRLARRWADVFGAGNVRVVTSPGKPVNVLWERFCEALAVPGLVDEPDHDTIENAVHVSLTASEAMVLREINSELERFGLSDSAAINLRGLLVKQLRERAERGPRIAVPEEFRETVATWSKADLAELEDVGVRTFGSIDDIRYTPEAGTARDLSAEATAHAAGVAVAAMMLRTPQPQPARPFPDVLRGYFAKWKLDFKRWLLAKWRAITVIIAFLTVTRVPTGGSSGDGASAQFSFADSIVGSVHDSVAFALSAGYG